MKKEADINAIFSSMRLFYCLTGLLFCFGIYSQEAEKHKNWEINGYLTSMNSVMLIDSLKDYWITDYLLHNRLNFTWHPSNSFTFNAELRNRFIYGDMVKSDLNGNYSKEISKDKGILDASFNVAEGKSYIFNSIIDRFWVKYVCKKLEITAGRQRINWGQTLVWNPNDIFNTYSFFDFDYPERPGSDAIRIQYYPGYTSVAEMAIKADSSGDITASGLYRFNKFGYDIQFLTGILNSEDIALGLGWSGNILSVAFRGEIGYFHPYRQFADTSGLFLVSAGFDYSFSNSLFLQTEFLYRQVPKGMTIRNFFEFYSGSLSVKNLSFTEYNFFIQVSYSFNPLLNGSLAVMYFPRLGGYYAGPSLNYSLTENFDFSIYLQVFSAKFPDANGIERKQTFNLGFMRFKYNF